MGKSNRVEETNDSSTASKLSMCRAGYISAGIYQNALEWFVKPERRTSLINRGYYIRVEAIQRLFDAFLTAYEDEEGIQIVNLGAGFDAIFLRFLRDDNPLKPMKFDDRYSRCQFVEVDFEKVMKKKADILRSKLRLPCDAESDRIFPNYALVSSDLLDAQSVQCKLKECGLRTDRPTLFLAECVLNYLPAKNADELLRTLSCAFQFSSFVVYEQIEPFDKFGQTMLKHFASIKSPLLSIDTYPSAWSQKDRYSNLGFPVVECWTIGHLYYNMLNFKERQRISALEMFDEYETWHAKCVHYVITIASMNEEQQARILKRFGAPSMDIIDSRPSTSSLRCTKHPLDISANQLRRFAHKSAITSRTVDNIRELCILSIGGWCVGDRNQHGRAKQPCQLDLRNYNAFNLDVVTLSKSTTSDRSDPKLFLERHYHSLTSISDRILFLFGGRRSPAEGLTLAVILWMNQDGDRIELAPIMDTVGPCGRWRHAAVSLNCHNGFENSLFICGGVAENDRLLADCWLFVVDDRVWKQLPDLPVPVHSHSVCWDTRTRLLIVIGGLTVDDQVCDRIQIYSFDQDIWICLEAPKMVRRYGASAFVISSDSIIVTVGGGSPERGECHDLVAFRIELDDDQNPKLDFCDRYALPDTSDFMLMNHDAVFDEIDHRIFIFGGGGNCFSFGTCFNDYVLEIDLNDLVKR